MNLRLIKQFTGLVFSISDFIENEIEEEEEKPKVDDSDEESDNSEDKRLEEEFNNEYSNPGLTEDRIKNELEKIKPRLAIFKCVGVGLKNHSREMA